MRIEKNPYDSAVLESLPLFNNVDPESIATQLHQCETWCIQAGELLLTPMQHNWHVFILLQGAMSVHLNSLNDLPVNFMTPGECLGEISVIDGRPPSALVVATKDSRLLAIPAETFWTLMDVSPEFNRNLLRAMCQRVRHTGHIIIDREKTAHLDSLTGLLNRRGLERRFARHLQQSLMTEQPFCLAMIDIDHFKRFNDQYGHLAGDKVLLQVAQALQEQLRLDDVVVRYGGEEFALLLPTTTLEKATKLAERVRDNIQTTPMEGLAATPLPPLTISIGIAQYQLGETLETLIIRADAALYEAKNTGRNRVCVALNP